MLSTSNTVRYERKHQPKSWGVNKGDMAYPASQETSRINIQPSIMAEKSMGPQGNRHEDTKDGGGKSTQPAESKKKTSRV